MSGPPLTLDNSQNGKDQQLHGVDPSQSVFNTVHSGTDHLQQALWSPNQEHEALLEIEEEGCLSDAGGLALTGGSGGISSTELPDPDPKSSSGALAIGYALVTDANSIVRDAKGQRLNARVPDGTLCELLAVHAGKPELAELRYWRAGSEVHVYTAASNLEGGGALPQQRAEVLLAERKQAQDTHVRGRTMDDLMGELKPGEVDPKVKAFQDTRIAALQGGADPSAMMSSSFGANKLAAPYQPYAKEEQHAAIAGQVRTEVNQAVFSEPGEAAPVGGDLSAKHIGDVQQRLLERVAAGQYLLAHVDQVRDYWTPWLQKFEDGQDYKGLKALFHKKNEKWKTLRKNQRRQQALPAVKWLRGLLSKAPETGPALNEVTWLVESHAQVRAAVQAGVDQALAVDLNDKGGLLGAESMPLPGPAQIQTADAWIAQLGAHLQVLGAPGLTLEVQTEKRKLAPKQEKTVGKVVSAALGEALPEEPALETETKTALGTDLVWTAEHRDEAGERIEGWLTVLGLPGLLELDMPVFASLSGDQRVGEVHLGDRVAWTGRVEERSGEPWLEVQTAEGWGWIQARYTNGGQVSAQIAAERVQAEEGEEQNLLETEPEAKDPERLFQPPPGLSVQRFLVLRDPGSAADLFADVYAQSALGQLQGPAWMLLGETGVGSSGRCEVLVGQAPRYLDSAAVREATPLDLLMNTAALNEAQLLEARDALAHEPVLQAEPLRRSAYHLALLKLAPREEGKATSRSRNRDALSGLAGALYHLGLPNPYPGHSYADALEMLRMEHGLAPKDLTGLAQLLGVDAAGVSSAEILDQLGQGRSVLVQAQDQVLRVVGVDTEGGLRLEAEGAESSLALSGVQRALSLGVPAEAEGQAQALKALEQGAQVSATERAERWKSLYAETTASQSAWYVAQLRGDGALAEQGKELGAWLPRAEEAASFASSPADKVLEVLHRHLAQGKGAGVASVAEGIAWVESWDAVQSGRDDVVEEMIADLRGQLGREMGAIARKDLAAGAAFVAQAESLSCRGEPLGGEHLRDVLKEMMLVVQPKRAPKKVTPADAGKGSSKNDDKVAQPAVVNKPTGGPGVINAGLEQGTANSSRPFDAAVPRYGDHVQIQVGSFNLDMHGSQASGRYGWLATGDAATIDGASFANLPSDAELMAAGLNETEVRLVGVRAFMEDGVGSDVNAYDKVYASFGFTQNTSVDEVGDGRSNVANMIGGTVYDAKGQIREGMGDIAGVLALVDLQLLAVGSGDWGFKVLKDPVLGACGPGDGFDWTDLRDLNAAHRLVMDRGTTPNEANFKQMCSVMKLPKQNRVALALRSSPERIGALAAIYADPRIQAAAAVTWAKDKLAEIEAVQVYGHSLADYPISERVAGVVGKLSNSLGGKGCISVVKSAFQALVSANPKAKGLDWGDQAAGWNSALEGLIVSSELSYRKKYHKPDDNGKYKHRAKDWLDAADEMEAKGVHFAAHFQGRSGTQLGDIAGRVQPGSHLAEAAGMSTGGSSKSDSKPGAGMGGFGFGSWAKPDLDGEDTPVMLRGIPKQGLRVFKTEGEDPVLPPEHHCVDDPQGLLSQARSVPLSALFGAELRMQMEQNRDPAVEKRVRGTVGAGWLTQAPDLAGLTKELTGGLEGLWERKRLSDLVGLPELGDEVDRYLVHLEQKAGHTREKVEGPGAAYGERAYDEALAKQWMEELFEAYSAVPVVVTLADGSQVTVSVKAKYRNFGKAHNDKHHNDYLGLIQRCSSMKDGYTSGNYTRALKAGNTDDGVAHSHAFLRGFQGKATPVELQESIQEAIATDPSLADELSQFESAEAAQKHLQDWLQLKLGLDCVGFAWNVLNGSGMTEDFTPVIYSKSGKGHVLESHESKYLNLACAGFRQVATELPDPHTWRTMDCIVSDSHIIVIYDVQLVDRGGKEMALMETMESCGSEGLKKRHLIWDTKDFRYSNAAGKTDGGVISGGHYDVFRGQNNAKVNAYLDAHPTK